MARIPVRPGLRNIAPYWTNVPASASTGIHDNTLLGGVTLLETTDATKRRAAPPKLARRPA
jgi:hypothetical protein